MSGYDPRFGRENLTRSQEKALHYADVDELDRNLPMEFYTIEGDIIPYVAIHPVRDELMWVKVEGELCPVSYDSIREWGFIIPSDDLKLNGHYPRIDVACTYDEDVGYEFTWRPDGGHSGEEVGLRWVPMDGDVYRLKGTTTWRDIAGVPLPDIKAGIHEL